MRRSVFVLMIFLSPILKAESEHSISVTGTCVKTVAPDRASVIVSAEVLQKTVGDATNKANDIYNKIRDSIKKLVLKNIELTTTQYNLFEQVDWEKNKSVSKGYKAIIGLSVSTSDLSRIGEVIQVASQIGAAQVSGLTSYTSVEKLSSVRESCLEDAILNAKQKAEKIAKAAGVSLGKLSACVENYENTAEPTPMMADGMLMKSEMSRSTPQIESGTKRVNVSVTASFGI